MSMRLRPADKAGDQDEHRPAALMGGLKVGYRRPARPGWKPLYGARLSGYRAGKLMRLLRPHMGQRRREQIDAALARLYPNR